MLQSRVSYSYYTDDFCMGGQVQLAEEQFARHEAQARVFLRGVVSAEIPEENLDDCRACICALAEAIEVNGGQTVKSESIDGYSVTYGDKGVGSRVLLDTANLYLGHLGVLYAGVE